MDIFIYGSHTEDHVKQATEEMRNVCEIDKQCIHVAVSSRKILVKAKYWIGTQYRQILRTRIGSRCKKKKKKKKKKKPEWDIPNFYINCVCSFAIPMTTTTPPHVGIIRNQQRYCK